MCFPTATQLLKFLTGCAQSIVKAIMKVFLGGYNII